MMSRGRGFFTALAIVAACGGTPATTSPGSASPQVARAAAAPAKLRVSVVASYPHARDAFTQGLVIDGATLYESTGQEGQSSLRRVDVTTGRVLQRVDQPWPIFSEGLAVVGPHLVQLTWKNGIAYQYDKKTFARTREWGYSGEGWGVCYDGQSLVTSDGSDRLTFRDPGSLAVRRDVRVTRSGRPRDQLNELECVDGSVWANVWMTDTIVRINPRTGVVLDEVDASGLLTAAERAQADVLNGIAYDASSKTFLITGKWWPKLFRVRFVP